MTRTKKVFIAIILIVILIQLIPISKNNGPASGPNDIDHAVPVNPAIKNILVTSCYDCHSDSSNYYWYFRIQPVAWWLNKHITEGKDELNFTVFNAYSRKRKLRKFKEIIEQISSSEMPLNSYTSVHPEASLSSEQKVILIEWAENSKNLIGEIE